MDRSVERIIKGSPAVDGAGVHLVRVLGHDTVDSFDPFLMLDSFDSQNPADYVAGFPMHPHRGIETLTYLVQGEIAHEDSMGNKDVIRDGEAQWMTAGSGILHEEMPLPREQILGFQLWINLPAEQKMSPPNYAALTAENIGIAQASGYTVRVLSGQYKDAVGFTPLYVQAKVFDIDTEGKQEIEIPVGEEETAFLFLLKGDAFVGDKLYSEKSALLLSKGSPVCFTTKGPGRVIFFSAPRLDEPIAWGGPIVMNTRAELAHAFDELRAGTFIK